MGETVSLNCNAVGHPAPDVFLYLNGTLLKRALSNLSHHFILDTEGNFGAYTCVSSNMFGTVNVTSTLKMKRKTFDELKLLGNSISSNFLNGRCVLIRICTVLCLKCEYLIIIQHNILFYLIANRDRMCTILILNSFMH